MSLNIPLMADIELASVSQTLKDMQYSSEEQVKESRSQLKTMVSLEADVRSAKTTTMKLKTAACRFHYLTHRSNCLVIIYEGGLISLFDLKTRKQVEKSSSHRLSHLRSSCMSPDEKLIAVAGESSIEIFEFTVTGICRLTEFKLENAQVCDIVFHNNDSFYTAGSDGKIKIWYINIKRNEVLVSLNTVPTRIIYSAGYLIIADERGSIHKYSYHFKIKSDTNRAHKTEITTLVLSKSEKLFASGSKDGTIKIWSFVTFEELQVLTLSGGITNLNFGINDLYLSSIHDSSTHIYVWKVGFDHDPVILEGHSDIIYDIYFTDSLNCAILYTSSRDKSLKISPYITNIRDSRCLKSQTKEFYRYLHAFDQSNIFINNGTSIEIWDMNYSADGKQHAAKMLTNKHPKGLMTVVFCEYVQSKKILLVVTQHGIIKYDTTTWDYISAEIDAEYQELKCCVIIPEKNVFLTGGSIGLINVRDLDSLEILAYMQEDGDAIESMDYLPNSNLMASTTGKRIYLWNLTLRICSKKSFIFDFEIYQIKGTKDEKHLITLNDEKNLSFWGLEYYNYKWNMHYDNDLIQSASYDNDSSHKILNFMLSNDDKYIYVAWSNATIEVWVRKTRVKITYISLANNFDFIQLHENQKHFYYGTAEGVRRVKNPITIDYFYIYHPKYNIAKTIELLNKIIDDKMHTHYDKEMDDIFIAPYHMNIISIYSYFGLIHFLKRSLKSNFAVFEDKDGISPLNVSIELKDIEVLEVIMDKFVDNVMENKFLAKLLESTLIELNWLGLECLPKVYDSLWRTSHNPKLSKFASKNQVLPIIRPSDSMVVLQQRFFGDADILVEDRGNLVIFKYSLIPFYIYTGSSKSFEFLTSISECPNSQIFQSPLIKEILLFKYSKCRIYLLFQTITYFLYLANLTALTYYMVDSSSDRLIYLFILLLLNTYLTFHELIQMLIIGNKYWADAWNWIDMLRGITCYHYIFTSFEPSHLSQTLLAVSFLSWLKGLSYFRLFKDLRYMINLIKQSFIDIKAFVVILTYTTLAFSLVQTILVVQRSQSVFEGSESSDGGHHDSFEDAFIASIYQVYNLILGNIDETPPNSILEWIFITMMIMIHPIIMLNLLISFLGATYDYVKEKSDIAEYQELAEIVMEVEQVMFWRRNRNFPKYFQMCIEKDQAESDTTTDIEKLERRVKYIKHTSHSLIKELTHFKEASLKKQTELENKIDNVLKKLK